MLCYLDGRNTFETLKFIRAGSQSNGIPVLETSVQLEKRLSEQIQVLRNAVNKPLKLFFPTEQYYFQSD
jgi:hypothetical protein